MKRWKKLVAVAGAVAGIAIASVAAASVGAAVVVQPTALAGPATGPCDHHTPGVDQIHVAMDGAMESMDGAMESMDGAMERMHDAMAIGTMNGMMGGMMGGAAPDMHTPHDSHHGAAGDVEDVR